jgi:hypothetical protein
VPIEAQGVDRSFPKPQASSALWNDLIALGRRFAGLRTELLGVARSCRRLHRAGQDRAKRRQQLIASVSNRMLDHRPHIA